MAEPDRPWTLASLATACGVAPRTLQKHFRRFLDRTPVAFVRELFARYSQHAGALPAEWGEGLADYVVEPGLGEQGEIVWREAACRSHDETVLRSVEHPFQATGGLRVLDGPLGRAVGIHVEHGVTEVGHRVHVRELPLVQRRQLHLPESRRRSTRTTVRLANRLDRFLIPVRAAMPRLAAR